MIISLNVFPFFVFEQNINIFILVIIQIILHLSILYSNQLSAIDVSNNSNLSDFSCDENQLSSLNVSNLWGLDEFTCSNNLLTILDLRNGANTDISEFDCSDNPNLNCIDVDDSLYCLNNWNTTNYQFDSHHYFSENCYVTTSIQEHTTNKELLKITDLLGRETKGTNQPLFYIYDDGTVEKRIIIE